MSAPRKGRKRVVEEETEDEEEEDSPVRVSQSKKPRQESEEEEEGEGEEGEEYDDQAVGGTTDEKLKQIVRNLSEAEKERYNAFKSSKFTKASIKKMMGMATDSPIGEDLVIAMKSIAKVFVGELVEEARTVMSEEGKKGPISKEALEKAYKRLDAEKKLPYPLQTKTRLFTR